MVPSSPLLEPALGGDPQDPAWGMLRGACSAAVAELLAVEPWTRPPSRVVVVGGAAETRRFDAGAWGTLAGFGADRAAPSHHDDRPAELPLSLTVGRLLLDQAGWRGDLVLQSVVWDGDAALVAELVASLPAEDCGWLVVGNGSAARTPRAPLSFDPRAPSLDAEVAAALAHADVAALAAIDPSTAAQVGAEGRAAWQVMAAVAARQPGAVEAHLRYHDAPAGVGYLVATWRCTP